MSVKKTNNKNENLKSLESAQTPKNRGRKKKEESVEKTKSGVKESTDKKKKEEKDKKTKEKKTQKDPVFGDSADEKIETGDLSESNSVEESNDEKVHWTQRPILSNMKLPKNPSIKVKRKNQNENINVQNIKAQKEEKITAKKTIEKITERAEKQNKKDAKDIEAKKYDKGIGYNLQIKERTIKNEIKRLDSNLKQIPKKKKLVAKGLIEEAAYMKATMLELKIVIDTYGPMDIMVQGSYSIIREHPALKAYNTTVQRYAAVIKLLTDMIPKEQPKEESDGFDEFVGSRDD